jgi:hypothetical protein
MPSYSVVIDDVPRRRATVAVVVRRGDEILPQQDEEA